MTLNTLLLTGPSPAHSAAVTIASRVSGARAADRGAVRQGGSGTSALFSHVPSLTSAMPASTPAEQAVRHRRNLEKDVDVDQYQQDEKWQGLHHQ